MKSEEQAFWLHPDNLQYWEMANDLRGDFQPRVVISYLAAWASKKQFKTLYRNLMVFADAAHQARSKSHGSKS